jgi:hypothetical protein
MGEVQCRHRRRICTGEPWHLTVLEILPCRLSFRAQLWNNILYVLGSAPSLAQHTTR